ncbi:MAG: nicotinate-nucleotide--dimethylbenzimidazole phosphoribosyltransferase [Nitrospira sp.]|nr:nicotinate-nucleotide--dimethylbenzimidazole phosphoribosyltransferase [Nitrospira sp.]MCP9442611.1 nicotinate-nucleotide--dimethylbenzimidazole phosphoribosyltransferase [Nitrospira sp.]
MTPKETASIQEVCRRVQPIDRDLVRQAYGRLDRLTKPPGSLGRLEELAASYVAMTGLITPSVPRGIVFTLAADHGVTKEQVSAYPQEVTPQMVRNFLRGGAAVNVLARHVGVEVRVVDIGVNDDFGPLPGLLDRKIRKGTRNFSVEPAMTRQEAEQAVLIGIGLARDAVQEGIGLIGLGEMGIGNTTPSAAITAVMTGRSVSEVTGHGTGIDDRRLMHKVSVIQRAIDLHQPDPLDPLDVLTKVGGLEIGGLVGVILGASSARVPVVLDGFITGAAALIAVALAPSCREYLIASHRSIERGHQVLLEYLDLKPLLDLGLRLGEGTGSCLGMSLVCAAITLYREMATFDEAGVSDRSADE